MNIFYKLILIACILIFPAVSFSGILWQQDLEKCNDIYCSGENDVEMYGRNNLKIVTIDGEKAVLHTNSSGDQDGGAYWRPSSGFSSNELWVRAWVYYAPGFLWRGQQRWKMFYFQNSVCNPFYVGFIGDGNFDSKVSKAYVGVIANGYGTKFSIPGYTLWGSTWYSEWDFDGQHSIRGSFTATPGNWYCWIIHVKNASGSGKGDGKLDIAIYDNTGKELFSVDMALYGSDKSGYNSYPYKKVMMDYTYNGGVVAGNMDYRDDVVVSSTRLDFAPRNAGGRPIPPSPPTNLRVDN